MYLHTRDFNSFVILQKENSPSTLPLLYLLVYKRDMAYILTSAPSDPQYTATTIPAFPFRKREKKTKLKNQDY